MPTFKSVQLTQVQPPNYAPLKPNELQGRLRLARFSFTTPAGMVINDNLEACVVPRGARIIGGQLYTDALGTSALAAVGVAGTPAKYMAAGSVAAAAALPIANTFALHGLETTVDETILITFTGANPAAAKVVQGYIMYVVD
jgi:hypothetical protein